MSTKIGRFEILGELAKSRFSCVYKANDPDPANARAEDLHLEVFGEQAREVVQRAPAEADTTKELSSPNLTLVYGAGEIDGRSAPPWSTSRATVSRPCWRARKVSPSGTCRRQPAGLPGTRPRSRAQRFPFQHRALQDMVTWDGTVKILSFGISSTGSGPRPPALLPPRFYYMSPEQIPRGRTGCTLQPV